MDAIEPSPQPQQRRMAVHVKIANGSSACSFSRKLQAGRSKPDLRVVLDNPIGFGKKREVQRALTGKSGMQAAGFADGEVAGSDLAVMIFKGAFQNEGLLDTHMFMQWRAGAGPKLK